jgi:hypothetical protein
MRLEFILAKFRRTRGPQRLPNGEIQIRLGRAVFRAATLDELRQHVRQHRSWLADELERLVERARQQRAPTRGRQYLTPQYIEACRRDIDACDRFLSRQGAA